MAAKLTVLLLICGLVAATTTSAAPPRAAHPAAAAKAKKKCRKGFVRKKGHCVCPKAKVRKGKKCVAKKKQATSKPKIVAPTTPGSPAPGTPATPGAPLFSPPGHDITGTEAANAILPFLANSTFTDCPTGFPTCAVEERYGHFASGTMYYCRLTPAHGSDIINAGHAFQIIGADQKADGSWAATLKVLSYGDALTYYTWTVTATGVATALYWGPGSSPQTDPANQQIGPLQWVRGARDCSY